MNEDRKKILSMLSEGKINTHEAERLLEALAGENNQSGLPSTVENTSNKGTPTYLYIKVEPKSGAGGKDKVDIRIPLKLMTAGMKLASIMPQNIQNKVNMAMAEKGLGFDLNKLSGENLDEFLSTLSDFSIDVDSDKERVTICCK